MKENVMDRLDWDDLKIFLQAARTLSVTRAANRLGIDHSTVSRRIARLEYGIGSSLFERHRKGLLLTASGVTVLRRAEEIEASFKGLQADTTGHLAAAGRVRIATMDGLASLYLARRLSELSRKHPDLEVELVVSPEAIRISRREADISLGFSRPQNAGIECERAGGFETGLYASAAYLDAYGRPTTAEDLLQHLFVGYIDEFIHLDAVRWLDELVKNPKFGFRSNSMIAQIGAAAGGSGIVVLPSFAVAHSNHSLRRILPDLIGHRELWLSWHPDLAHSGRIRAARRFLLSVIAEDPLAFPYTREANMQSQSYASTDIQRALTVDSHFLFDRR